jgi:DNA-directed RNA polymerase subunit E'/Rpb7
VLLFFVIPVRARPKTILIASFIFEVFYCLTQEVYGAKIASSAHMGGMLGGVLYFYLQSIFTKKKNKNSHQQEAPENYKIYISNNKKEIEEIDRILNKINTQGFGSLTEEEKEILNSSKHLLYR